MLDEKLEVVNKALTTAAENNLKPREKIDRTFSITDKIKEIFKERDELNKLKRFKETIKLGKEIMNLVFCARGYMKPGLSHNWHVQVVHKCHFKTFGTFVVITVVKGLAVEKRGVPIVFASFCTLKRKRIIVE